MCVVKAYPARGLDRCCRNQKPLNYEIETRGKYHAEVNFPLCRNQKPLNYEIETSQATLSLPRNVSGRNQKPLNYEIETQKTLRARAFFYL